MGGFDWGMGGFDEPENDRKRPEVNSLIRATVSCCATGRHEPQPGSGLSAETLAAREPQRAGGSDLVFVWTTPRPDWYIFRWASPQGRKPVRRHQGARVPRRHAGGASQGHLS